MILNLKVLRQNVDYHHFEMETQRDALALVQTTVGKIHWIWKTPISQYIGKNSRMIFFFFFFYSLAGRENNAS